MRARTGHLVKRLLGLLSRVQPPAAEVPESGGPASGPKSRPDGDRIVHPPALGGRAIEIDALDSLGLAGGGDFEPEETALCRALVSPGQRCLDVGANIGYFTVLLAELCGSRGRVMAFEPDSENFRILSRNCAPEVTGGQVLLRQAALGKDAATARLFMGKDNMGMHRLYPSVCCKDDWHEVPVLAGDSLDLGPVDFIKIDIEGYEPAALEGLAGTISVSPQIRIMSELSPLSMLEAGFSPTDFVRRMLGLGLQPWGRSADGWAPLNLQLLLADLSTTETIDVPSVARTLRGQSVAAVLRAAAEALLAAGYRRAVLETLLWVGAHADEDTRRRLAVAELLAMPDPPPEIETKRLH